MSRGNLSCLKRLEKTGNRVADWRYMTDEQLFNVRFSDDRERFSLILEADRLGDRETVARMLGKDNARAI